VASTLYELPFGQGKAYLSGSNVVEKIFGGWQIGGIVTLSEGAPTNVGSIGDSFSVGGLGNRPHATGVSPILDNPTVDAFWDINAFDTRNANLSWLAGNAGRNVLSRPGTVVADLSLSKNIRIKEGHQLQFRFETFNSFNHPNWDTPGTDARSASTFGKVNTAKTMRELQFGLKYVF
jgi:hypothetical protein